MKRSSGRRPGNRQSAEELAAQLAEIQEIAGIGSWHWSEGSNRFTGSDQLHRIYDIPSNDFPLTFESLLDRVHPEDRDLTRGTVEAAFRDRTRFECDHRIVRPDGSIRWVRWRGQVEDSGQGEVGMAGICQDVTAARQREEDLRLSEAKFRGLLESAPDAIVILRSDGRIHLVNAQAEAMFGYMRVELGGKPIEVLVPGGLEGFPGGGGDGAPVAARVSATDIDPGLLGRHKNGTSFPVEVSLSPLATTEGTLVTAIVRDISGRQRIQEERQRLLIREQVARAEAAGARRLGFLSEASKLLVSSLDYETTLASVARLAVPELADWSAVDMMGADLNIRRVAAHHHDPSKIELVWELNHRFPPAPDAPQGVARVLRTGEPELIASVTSDRIEARARSPEHLELLRRLDIQSLMIVPLRVRDRCLGAITFASAGSGRHFNSDDLAVAEEVAVRCASAVDHAVLHQQVTRERDRAESASRAKDEFLAILSHELRNPLTPVIGWVRTLKRRPEIINDAVLGPGIASMERNAENIEKLIEDCLELVRVAERKIRLERQVLDLDGTVSAVVEGMAEQARKKEVRLDTELAGSGLLVSADPARLDGVVTNIISNALKYTEKGDAIIVRTVRAGGWGELEVRDTGAGIAPEFLDQVFEPFRQSSEKWLTSESGLGLGLSIAKHIVEMHGGEIGIESAGVGQGTTVRVRLPLENSRATEPAVPETADPPPVDQPLRVLVIDDSEDVLFLIQLELEWLGHKVFVAHDGVSGMEIARREKPNVIISDIKMPGMDGYELIRQIRSSARMAHIPVIALTGFGMKRDIERAIAGGFDAHIVKPGDIDQLANLIRDLTRKK